ncbi:DUF6366 family protein [Neobacillus drentensis]
MNYRRFLYGSIKQTRSLTGVMGWKGTGILLIIIIVGFVLYKLIF